MARKESKQTQLPDFVVIGASAAGTDTLHSWLDDHPEVCMSPREGLDFFLEQGAWSRGVGWYRLRFGGCSWEQTRGESSPNYSRTHLDPGIPERMHSIIPKARLVYVVREPIERMRSMFKLRSLEGSETRSFEQAVADDPDYRETSRYIQHIGAFLKHYSKDRLLVVTTERLATDPAGTLAAVYAHVGVEPITLSTDEARREVTADQRIESTLSRRMKANPGYWRALNRSWRLRNLHERIFTRQARVPPTQLSRTADAELRDSLEKDTQALEVFLGRKLTEWGR